MLLGYITCVNHSPYYGDVDLELPTGRIIDDVLSCNWIFNRCEGVPKEIIRITTFCFMQKQHWFDINKAFN